MGTKYPGFDPNTWVALYAPAGTPQPVVDTLDAAVRAELQSAEMRKRLADIGMSPFPLASKDLAGFVRTDTERWAKLIQTNAITAD